MSNTKSKKPQSGRPQKSAAKTKKLGEEQYLGSRIRVQWDVSYNGHPGRKIEGKSETIPDMTLTVRQLLENHTRGIDDKVRAKKPLYFELPIPVINDMTDVDRYRENLKAQIKSVDEFIKNEKSAKTEEGDPLPFTDTNSEAETSAQPSENKQSVGETNPS